MNISVHLQFTSLAAAVAFLAAGEKAQPGAAIAGIGAEGVGNITADEIATPPAPTPEVKPGKPKAAKASTSAAPAAAPSAASTQEAASAPTAASPTPSTSETASAAAKLPAYADTDLPTRIMALVQESKTSGDKSKVNSLKALLSEMGVASAKDLTPEQVVVFTPKFAAIEAPAEDDASLA